jgi:hypothetical protein
MKHEQMILQQAKSLQETALLQKTDDGIVGLVSPHRFWLLSFPATGERASDPAREAGLHG